MAFRGQYEHNLDSKDRLTVPARFRAALADGVVLSAGLDPCVEVYPTSEFARFEQRVLAELNPLSRHGRMMKRRFHGRSHDETLDSAGRIRIPRHLIEHAELEEGPCVVIGVADHLEIWNTKRWADHDAEIDATAAEIAEELAHGGPGRRERPAEVRGADSEMATLTYMPTEHVPVLASELIALLDPRPGETAVDCTFGGGGHARLVAERLGPGGTLICIDRDPTAEQRFEELADELECETRFLRANFADALAELAGEGARADLVYMDLGISSLQLDAAETGLLLHLRRAARHAHGSRPRTSRRPRSSTSGRRIGSPGSSASTERSATPGRSHARSSAAAPSRPRPTWSRRFAPRSRPPTASGAATRRSGPSRRSGSPSTRSWTRSTGRCPRPGSSCARAGAWV